MKSPLAKLVGLLSLASLVVVLLALGAVLGWWRVEFTAEQAARLEADWERIEEAGGPLDATTSPALQALLEGDGDEAVRAAQLVALMRADPDLQLAADGRIVDLHSLAEDALSSEELTEEDAAALLAFCARALRRGTLVTGLSAIALLRTAHELAPERPALAAALAAMPPLAEDTLYRTLCRDAVALNASLTSDRGPLTLPVGTGELEVEDLEFLQRALQVAHLRVLAPLEAQRNAPHLWDLDAEPETSGALATWWALSNQDVEGSADLMAALVHPPLRSAVTAWTELRALEGGAPRSQGD